MASPAEPANAPAASTTERSSRTLPGQSRLDSQNSASAANLAEGAVRRRNNTASRGTSSRRSASAGVRSTTPLRR